MLKKKLKLVIITGIVILILAIIYILIKNNITDEGFIKVRLYDANGNPITPALSIVSNVEGVRYIDLTITATSSGSVPLSCSLSIPDTKVNSQIPPNVFSDALPDNTPKILSGIGSKVEWTTSLIDISGLESTPTPDVFSTKVICSYTDASGTNYLEQTGNVSITIGPEGSTGFTVNVNSGGLPSLWCGDNICSSGENATSCPADCGGTISKVNFRTSDLSYPLGSAIAYNPGTCGNALTQYGYDTTTCWNTDIISGVNVYSCTTSQCLPKPTSIPPSETPEQLAKQVTNPPYTGYYYLAYNDGNAISIMAPYGYLYLEVNMTGMNSANINYINYSFSGYNDLNGDPNITAFYYDFLSNNWVQCSKVTSSLSLGYSGFGSCYLTNTNSISSNNIAYFLLQKPYSGKVMHIDMIQMEFNGMIVNSMSNSDYCPIKKGYKLIKRQVPGKPNWAVGDGCLYSSADNQNMAVVWKLNSPNYISGCNSGDWGAIIYSDNQYKTRVDSNPSSINLDKETPC